MRFKWNRHYLGWGLTAFAVLVASNLISTMLTNYKEVFGAIGKFMDAIKPIFLGLIFAYLMAPVVSFFENRCFKNLFVKNDKKPVPAAEATENTAYSNLKCYVLNKPRRILSVFTATAVVLLIIVAIGLAVVPQLMQTITLLVDNIPTYIKDTTEWVNNMLAGYPEIGSEITAILNEAGTMLRSFLTTSILPQMGDYVGFLTTGIMNVIGVFMNLLVGIVVAIYCLYSKELFAAQTKKLLYFGLSTKHANGVINGARKLHKTFGNFITGTLIDSFVLGCLTFIVTTIFNVPFALLVSVIMGITNIIPYFGPFIGIVPCLFLILMENPVMCLVFIAIVIVLQNLNGNIISPKILGQSMGLSSFWVIFAILAGQGLFGFWGLIIGIPIFAVLYGAFGTFVSGKLSAKGLPHDSDSYSDIETINSETLAPVSLSDKLEAERESRSASKKHDKADNGGIINKIKALFSSESKKGKEKRS